MGGISEDRLQFVLVICLRLVQTCFSSPKKTGKSSRSQEVIDHTLWDCTCSHKPKPEKKTPLQLSIPSQIATNLLLAPSGSDRDR